MDTAHIQERDAEYKNKRIDKRDNFIQIRMRQK